MDYITEALNNSFIFNKNNNEVELNGLQYEFDTLEYCLKEGIVFYEITQESLGDVAKSFEKFVKNIIEFFDKIINSFIKKVKELTDINGKWLSKNTAKFASLDFTNLKTTLYPEWNMPYNKIKTELDNISSLLNNIPNDEELKELQDRDSIIKEKFSKYIPEGKDARDSFIQYFTIGNSKVEMKQVSIEGNDFKNKCLKEFIPYVDTYSTTVGNDLKNRKNKITASLRKINSSLVFSSGREKVGESFLSLEDLYYPLIEAEQPAQSENDNKEKQSNNKDKEPSPGTVVNKEKDAEKNKYNNMNNLQIKYVKIVTQLNQLAVACAMNVLEKRYKTYIKILRSTIKATTAPSDNKKEKEKK